MKYVVEFINTQDSIIAALIAILTIGTCLWFFSVSTPFFSAGTIGCYGVGILLVYLVTCPIDEEQP